MFLNLAAYFQNQPEENVVTIVLEQISTATSASFHSKEGNGMLAPRLVVDGLLQFATPALAGDYNGDDVVDAADYTVWRDSLNSNTSLTNETASLGVVDQEDYDAWKANFGAVAGSGGSAEVAGTVPEPTSVVLLLIGFIAWSSLLRRAGSRHF